MSVDSFGDVEKQAYFGVYDGHGGNSCAVYCAENLHKVRFECFKHGNAFSDSVK